MMRVSAALGCVLMLTGSLMAGPSPQDLAFFENSVRPLLAMNCVRCHGAKKQESGLRLDGRAAILRGGTSGPAVVAGKPADSLLLKVVQHQGNVKMPPDGKLTKEQIATLAKWVDLGVPWPEEAVTATYRTGEVTDEERRFWSFQPVREPQLPAVRNAAWVRSPVDAFVLHKLEQAGIAPAAPADRRTLLRRLTFDLTGLPPSPEEVAEFEQSAIRNPQSAIEQTVDRLLASPAYGERWGRHWLDVVRYADTAGETADFPVREAYRYRDYVIASFQRDKPYDQFVREQIAGDVLARTAPRERYGELVTATGFLALSRRFGFDPQNYHHLTIQDTLDTLGQSVLGLSLGCARCHHHKFDPVSMSDYYALYGIFDSTAYAFPGSEEKQKPRDFIPLVPVAEVKDPKTTPVAYAVVEGKPHNVRLQKRGDPLQVGEEIPRRNLDLLGGTPVSGEGGSGRLQLADWLTDPANPLTARVMVNRIWQHHFGTGLVATENDFGTRGQRPSHPELLDYLAARFVASGWSIKALHRLIVLSATYQQCAGTPSERDPENRLLGRWTPRRLEAEAIRDSLLAAAGTLDRSPGGPHPFPPVESWGFTQHNPFKAVYDHNRRSVYLMTQRLQRHPFLALFDGPDPNASTPHRFPTTVPTQALFFLNDPFVHTQSAALARRLLATRPDESGQIEYAYLLTLGRLPTPEERARDTEFLAQYRDTLSRGGIAPQQRGERALAALARTLFGRNEFLYID
jgi:hypothetical protein